MWESESEKERLRVRAAHTSYFYLLRSILNGKSKKHACAVSKSRTFLQNGVSGSDRERASVACFVLWELMHLALPLGHKRLSAVHGCVQIKMVLREKERVELTQVSYVAHTLSHMLTTADTHLQSEREILLKKIPMPNDGFFRLYIWESEWDRRRVKERAPCCHFSPPTCTTNISQPDICNSTNIEKETYLG